MLKHSSLRKDSKSNRDQSSFVVPEKKFITKLRDPKERVDQTPILTKTYETIFQSIAKAHEASDK
jgi:hypothetical protein